MMANKARTAATILALCGTMAGTAAAAPAADTVEANLTGAVKIDRAAQKQIRTMIEEETVLLDKNRALRLEMPFFELEQAKLLRYTAALKEKIARLEEAHARYAEIALLLEASLVQVVDELEATLADDLPFAREERQARVAFLRTTLDDPSLGVGEKFRRVAEALNVEADYGMGHEETVETVLLDGKETTANVIRIGRVALFALTLDRETAGIWSKEKDMFVTDPALIPVLKKLTSTMESSFRQRLLPVPVREVPVQTQPAREKRDAQPEVSVSVTMMNNDAPAKESAR